MGETIVNKDKETKRKTKSDVDKYSSSALTYYKNLAVVLGSPIPLAYISTTFFHYMTSLTNIIEFQWAPWLTVFLWLGYALTVFIWASAKIYGLLVLLKHRNLDRGDNYGKVLFTKTCVVITQLFGVGIIVLIATKDLILFSLIAGLLLVTAQALSFKYVPQLAASLKEESK